MSVPAYPAYSEHDTTWFGRLPAHWRSFALKRDLEFLTSGSRGWAEHYSDDGAIFVRIGNLTRESLALDLSDVQRVVVPPGSEGERTKLKPGDLLFSITAFMGSVAVAPPLLEPAYVSQHVALARLRGHAVIPRWVGYVALSAGGKAYLNARCYGGTKIQLSLNDVADLPLPVPPRGEQAAIVDFLDRECGKIDALVAEQERLIALLKEKRQAVISHAVTKGLDPAAPMKDSGIEWLGRVPAGWEIRTLKHLITENNAGEVIDRSFWGGDDELLYTCAVEPMPCEYSLFPEWKRTKESDLLLTRNGTPYVHKPVPGSIYTNVVQRIGLKTILDRDFIAISLQNSANNLRGYGVSIESLNFEMWKELRLAVPAVEEQESIVRFIAFETGELDTLTSEVERAITLLRERRAALISAAVTGKIDVRGLVATAEAKAA